MATAADPRGYPVGRRIACVFHILTPASMGLAPVLKIHCIWPVHSLHEKHDTLALYLSTLCFFLKYFFALFLNLKYLAIVLL